MRICLDIEANALVNPTHIWLIVCKDIDTGRYYIFRNVTEDAENFNSFVEFSKTVTQFIGHNVLGYDLPVLVSFLLDNGRITNEGNGSSSKTDVTNLRWFDTLILSKLVDYSRKGHSIEDYGIEFGLQKGKFTDFSKYSKEMEDYCVRDVDICEKIYRKYLRYSSNPEHQPSIVLEHQFQLVVNSLHDNGFCFNSNRATPLLERVTKDLAVLDKEILEAFPPKLKLIREITPKETKHGTLSKTDFRWVSDGDLSEFNGGSFCRCSWESFNPSSHKQIIAVLSQAGWSPTDRTQSHIDTERAYNQLKYKKGFDKDKLLLYDKLQSLKKSGWKINESNLETLSAKAPTAARLLAKRILLEARRRTLTEWLDLVWFEIEISNSQLRELGIKEKPLSLNGLRRSVANVENGSLSTPIKSERITKEIISDILTDCQLKMLLEWLKSSKVNVQSVKRNENSTSIIVIGQVQLENFCVLTATVTSDGSKQTPFKYKIISERIHGKFNGLGAWSHRMNHQNPNTANIPNEFDTAGKRKLLGKELRSLWCAPKNRLLVGVDAEGIQLRIFAHLINDLEFTDALVKGKKDDKTDPHSLNQRIIGHICKSRQAAKRFIYALLLGAGLPKLAEILGCSESEAREGLARLMERYTGWATLKEEVFPTDARRGYFIGLDGRKVRIPGDTEGTRRHLAMSGYLQNGEAVVMKSATLKWADRLIDYDAKLVNFVHDEWQVECPNNMTTALELANLMSTALGDVGKDLGLHCPLAGSYFNDDLKDYTIATNWAYTH